jgi:hypothetical protein
MQILTYIKYTHLKKNQIFIDMFNIKEISLLRECLEFQCAWYIYNISACRTWIIRRQYPTGPTAVLGHRM